MEGIRGLVRLGKPSNEKPKMGELNKFLTEYCKLWRSIGYKLELEDAVLDMIQSDHRLTQRERFEAALQKWLEQDVRPTWNSLELAITNARREELSLEPLLKLPVQQPDDRPKQEGDKRQEKQTSSTSDLLSVHFSTFLITIRRILVKCEDKLEACKELCSNLTISGNSDILLFSDEQLAKINECTSFQQLFTILRKHWNWKEYSILKGIITECGSEEARDELHKFQKLMGSYYGMKLISDNYLPSELPENYVKLCITVDQPYKDLTLNDYDELRTFIFKHLDVKKYIALPFIKFLFSSLHLMWYIPVQAVSHIIKVVHRNNQVLIQKSIVLIKIGDKIILDVHRELSQTDISQVGRLSFPEHRHLTCLECGHLFKNPKYLPCYHSYCEECLEKMQKQSKIMCPECTKETMVPDGGVKGLPNNHFMNHLVNKLILCCKVEGKIELRCEECDEDDPVTVFCTDCKLFYCYFCEESHKYNRIHSNHNLLSLTELRINKDFTQLKSGFPTCQNHDLEFEYYCETCEKLVCVQCTGEHNDHKYDVVKKIANKYQNEVKNITALIEAMIENLSKTSEAIDAMTTAIIQQGEEISEEIDLYYDEVFRKLLKQKEQVKQQVRYTVLQKKKAMIKQMREVISTEEEILNVKRIRDSVQENSDQEILSAKDQLVYLMEKLKEKCEKLGTEPVESANIKVTPVNEPLPQFVKHFATIDSLSFEVKNFSSCVQRGQMAVLEIITKDSKGGYYPRGGCEVTVEVESKTGEMINAQPSEVMDYNNGTYMICFVAQQVGEINLSVFMNGREIKESPFRIVVQENPIEPSKIITSHDDSFGQLCGIACSRNGMWAVADWIKNCVYIFDSRDKLVKKLGRESSGNEYFKYPCDVAFDDNNELYVTDSRNHRVHKFDTYGDYLLQFGSKGSNEGQLNYPIGIATHYDKVYVADRRNSRISVFQNDGKFHSIIGQQQLSQYFDISINIYDEILVADWRNHCIYFFTLDGRCTDKVVVQKGNDVQLKNPCYLTTDSDGFILIVDITNHCVSIYDKIGNCICCFGSKGSDDGEFDFPRGIAVAPNGDIYISDTCNKRVQVFSANYY